MHTREEEVRRKERPSLFEKEKTPVYTDIFVPKVSMYDEKVVSEHVPMQSTIYRQQPVIVFGYSAQNLSSILSIFEKIGKMKKIGYGTNWVEIVYEKEKYVYTALKENGSIYNEEMIGVISGNKKEPIILQKADTQLLKSNGPGVIPRILSYLFG